MRTRWITGVLSGVLAVTMASTAWAARLGVHAAAESPEYGRKAGGMLGRGLLNVATCFVDPIVNVVNDTKAGPPLVGTLTGAGKGLGCGVLRLGSGVVDVLTFWVPGFNGMPVSDSYTNCLAVSTEGGQAVVAEPPAPSYASPAATPEVPTTEPGAAQAPPRPSPKPKREWVK